MHSTAKYYVIVYTMSCNNIITAPKCCCNNYNTSGAKRDRTILCGTVVHLASYRRVDVYQWKESNMHATCMQYDSEESYIMEQCVAVYIGRGLFVVRLSA